MKIFQSRSKAAIGLDVGSGAVKLLQLTRAGGALRVSHFAHERLPAGAISNENITDSSAVAAAIATAVRRGGIKTKQCVMAVSGSNVITRTIHIPAEIADSDLESRIELDAGQHIPYPLDEVNIDFTVLGPAPRNAELKEVLLVASRKENVNFLQGVAEEAGFKLCVVDVEAFALANAFNELVRPGATIAADQTIALLDIGNTSTNLVVSRDGRLLYTREQPFGSQSLFDEMRRRYGDEAADINPLLGEGTQLGDLEDEILAPYKAQVVQQVSRALQFYSSSAAQYNPVNRIFLSGASAGIPGLGQMMDDELGIAAEVANPIAGLKVTAAVAGSALQQHAAGLMVAAGLALRGVE